MLEVRSKKRSITPWQRRDERRNTEYFCHRKRLGLSCISAENRSDLPLKASSGNARATILGIRLLRADVQSETLANSSKPTADANWSELVASMDKMHMAMAAIKRSGKRDIDFVRLMLPHHQAAIDMAKHNSCTAKMRKCADSPRKSLPINN